MKEVDVVIIGFGWAGAIMAKELTEAGLHVLALERGQDRDTYPDGAYPTTLDELTYLQRFKLFQDMSRSTFTFRHSVKDMALPYRQIGAFRPGEGVGGAGLHWAGQHWRVYPQELRLRSHYVERYGTKFIPKDMTLQDFGVSYEELEPYFDFAEKVFGTSGQAYRVNGQVVGDGNPFEADRSAAFPLPAQKVPYGPHIFMKAAREVGFHPFRAPSATVSAAYTNPYGCQMGPCNFCGFCSGYACYNYSKASPNVNVLPALRGLPNFELRPNCNVLRIMLDNAGKVATGVEYIDAAGKLVMQPARIVIASTFAYNNAHLFMLSGIGRQYDPVSGEGTVGKNVSYQMLSNIQVFFEPGTNSNPFIGAGGNSVAFDDFNGDNFDHGPHGFVGGAALWCNPAGAKPISGIAVPAGTPRWGNAWKKSVKDHYVNTVSIDSNGANMVYRDCYLDLDPTYKNKFGQPLLRFTFDWKDNDIRMTRFVTDKLVQVAKAMEPKDYTVTQKDFGDHFDVRPYQTTHWAGGLIMGEHPQTSALNRYLQSWDVHNVFAIGSNAFPVGLGYNPTGVVAALAYWSAKAIRTRYLKDPGPLVDA
ncbi:Gluconate 2-dehydrogenase, membrane-bound, flavoprotein [Caballeronia sordidicola]|uniref:Gluconate 2-dehydrogenase, membrane-bound, flavoprotein n=2 Tax=Caballeronia sordidicola TaxID=196367 RepID=A0A226WPN4_CABSO|nr:Gluconate 2-dehydrogenase, membrane-bound, flavoprotein [Caballeronia sordidicola]